MKLADRHVVITGASSGIGEALALACAGEGARLTLVARRRDLLEKLATRTGVRCHIIERDLGEPPPADWLDEAKAALGPIDVFVNNAGMENTGPTHASSVEVGLRVLRLNLETPLVIIRHLLPELIARGGAIVNVASVAGLAPVPQQTWYGASKAGLAAFSESLRGELLGTKVQVLTVYPGPVTTAMAEAAYLVYGGRTGVAGRMPEGKPDVLATQIVRALGTRKARLIYPRAYVFARWFPWLARALTDRLTPKAHPMTEDLTTLRR